MPQHWKGTLKLTIQERLYLL